MARKILLADDSVTAQNMGRKILADAGYEVITVNNGSAALKKIAEVKPDLIVLDVYMPGYSGLEVCQRLKEAPETSRIPVLLTVGKLEPFKPEEAKRVRAEGFIVKPFEASELLTAITKLEDKMVPRGESSKPGRFARTIAAVEEGRYDKTTAPAEEDSGWKSRINFPSKKKEKAQQEEASDEAAIYNPVNKDLRTVVESKATAAPPAAKASPVEADAEQGRVDVTALAPAGLPKDVTAEEIAALAAAAAQIQGKLAEARAGDAKIADGASAEAKIPEFQTVPPPDEATATARVEDKVEMKAEAVADGRDQTQPAKIEPESAIAAIEPKLQEKNEEKKAEAADGKAAEAREVASSGVPAAPEPIASIGISEAHAAMAKSTGNGDGAHDGGQQAEPEPVTMAVAAAAASGGYSSARSRWTAVSVALAPEEASIALEDEMRKAYAAYSVPAESQPAEAISSVAEIKPIEPTIPPEALSAIPAIESASIAAMPLAAPAEPEATRDASSVISGASEIAYPAVKSFEAVSVSRFNGQSAEKTPAESIPMQAPVPEAPAPEVSVMESPKSVEAAQIAATSDETPSVEAEKIDAKDETVTAPIATSEPVAAIDSASSHDDGPKYGEKTPGTESTRDEAAVALISSQAASIEETTGASEPEPVIETHAATETVASAADAGTTAETSTSKSVPAGDESHIAASTAAAWESWRRIRESGDPRGKRDAEKESSREVAAMAVAAGAEKAPELQEGPEIASIVDSVLADLRPKIVEEISRKLKKK